MNQEMEKNEMDIEKLNAGLHEMTVGAALKRLNVLTEQTKEHPRVVLYDGERFHDTQDAEGKGYEVWVTCGDTLISSHGVESDNAYASAALAVLALKLAKAIKRAGVNSRIETLRHGVFASF